MPEPSRSQPPSPVPIPTTSISSAAALLAAIAQLGDDGDSSAVLYSLHGWEAERDLTGPWRSVDASMLLLVRRLLHTADQFRRAGEHGQARGMDLQVAELLGGQLGAGSSPPPDVAVGGGTAARVGGTMASAATPMAIRRFQPADGGGVCHGGPFQPSSSTSAASGLPWWLHHDPSAVSSAAEAAHVDQASWDGALKVHLPAGPLLPGEPGVRMRQRRRKGSLAPMMLASSSSPSPSPQALVSRSSSVPLGTSVAAVASQQQQPWLVWQRKHSEASGVGAGAGAGGHSNTQHAPVDLTGLLHTASPSPQLWGANHNSPNHQLCTSPFPGASPSISLRHQHQHPLSASEAGVPPFGRTALMDGPHLLGSTAASGSTAVHWGGRPSLAAAHMPISSSLPDLQSAALLRGYARTKGSSLGDASAALDSQLHPHPHPRASPPPPFLPEHLPGALREVSELLAAARTVQASPAKLSPERVPSSLLVSQPQGYIRELHPGVPPGNISGEGGGRGDASETTDRAGALSAAAAGRHSRMSSQPSRQQGPPPVLLVGGSSPGAQATATTADSPTGALRIDGSGGLRRSLVSSLSDGAAASRPSFPCPEASSESPQPRQRAPSKSPQPRQRAPSESPQPRRRNSHNAHPNAGPSSGLAQAAAAGSGKPHEGAGTGFGNLAPLSVVKLPSLQARFSGQRDG